MDAPTPWYVVVLTPTWWRMRIIAALIGEAVWLLRMAGKCLKWEEGYSYNMIDNALRGMWEAGLWSQRIDGSKFEVH